MHLVLCQKPLHQAFRLLARAPCRFAAYPANLGSRTLLQACADAWAFDNSVALSFANVSRAEGQGQCAWAHGTAAADAGSIE